MQNGRVEREGPRESLPTPAHLHEARGVRTKRGEARRDGQVRTAEVHDDVEAPAAGRLQQDACEVLVAARGDDAVGRQPEVADEALAILCGRGGGEDVGAGELCDSQSSQVCPRVVVPAAADQNELARLQSGTLVDGVHGCAEREGHAGHFLGWTDMKLVFIRSRHGMGLRDGSWLCSYREGFVLVELVTGPRSDSLQRGEASRCHNHDAVSRFETVDPITDPYDFGTVLMSAYRLATLVSMAAKSLKILCVKREAHGQHVITSTFQLLPNWLCM